MGQPQVQAAVHVPWREAWQWAGPEEEAEAGGEVMAAVVYAVLL